MHIGLTGWQREAAEGDHRELLALFQQAENRLHAQKALVVGLFTCASRVELSHVI